MKTRPSCLECVTKHLGAAWVLIKEHHDGYDHKMMAIGHLHEAEDESQEWPELNAFIRQSRKMYFQTNECPKFEVMAMMIEGILNASHS